MSEEKKPTPSTNIPLRNVRTISKVGTIKKANCIESRNNKKKELNQIRDGKLTIGERLSFLIEIVILEET